MIKPLLSSLLLLFVAVNMSAQNCGNDSIVTTYTHQVIDGDITNTIVVDSFDLTSGTNHYCERTGIGIPGAPVCNQAFFSRPMLSLNANHDTLQYILLDGNGFGFTNNHKIEFTYDLTTNQPLTRNEFDWIGAAWSLLQSETWTYDVNNSLTNYILSRSTGNVLQKTFTYSGNRGVSAIFQSWSGSSWVNNERYLFTYNAGGLKDSLYVQNWIGSSSSWHDSLNSKFDTLYSYSAPLSRTRTWLTYTENFLFRIDSLNNITYQYNDNDSSFEGIVIENKYFNGHLNPTHIGHNYDSWNTQEYFSYNSFGFLTFYSSESTSSINASYYDYSYDSLSRPTSLLGGHNSGVGDGRIEEYYYYSSSDQISLSYLPVEDYDPYRCQGDSIPAVASVHGGCGPYHFSWTPSTGLSSDTVAEPMIFMTNDSVTYTITATDTTGHSMSTTLIAYPDVSAHITIDTTVCTGCPVVLNASTGFNYTYQWYFNNVLMPGETNSSITPVLSGDYQVEITGLSGCQAMSDPYNFIYNNIFNPNSADYLIYPNPADENIFIEGINQSSEIIVTDVSGKQMDIISERDSRSNNLRLNISKLTPGIYFIRISSAAGVIHREFVVNHN